MPWEIWIIFIILVIEWKMQVALNMVLALVPKIEQNLEKGVHKLDELEIIWHFSYNNPFSLTFSMLFLFILHQRNMTKETALALACIKHFINHCHFKISKFAEFYLRNFKIPWPLQRFKNSLAFFKITWPWK